MVGRARKALPNAVPTARPVNGAKQVGDGVRACYRHTDGRRGDDIRIRRNGGAQDRSRQRERRADRIGVAPGVNRHFPHAGLRVGRCAAGRAAGGTPTGRAVVAVADRIRVDRQAIRMPAQEADGARAGRAAAHHVHLEGRRAGRDVEEVGLELAWAKVTRLGDRSSYCQR